MITCSAGLGFWFQDSITSNFISCPNVCNPEIKIRNIKDIKEIKIISLKTVTEGNNCLFERNVVIKIERAWTIGKKLPQDAINPAHGSLLRVNSPSHFIFSLTLHHFSFNLVSFALLLLL